MISKVRTALQRVALSRNQRQALAMCCSIVSPNPLIVEIVKFKETTRSCVAGALVGRGAPEAKMNFDNSFIGR